MQLNPNLGKRGSNRPLAHSYTCSSYVWHSIKSKLLDVSDQHVLHMCIKFQVHKLNTHWDMAILWKPLFYFSYEFLNFPLISLARWLKSENTAMVEKRKKGDARRYGCSAIRMLFCKISEHILDEILISGKVQIIVSADYFMFG